MKWWWQLRKRDADVERELQSDLDLEEEEQRERGVLPQEAHHAALRAFGNPILISEQTRAVWSGNGWGPAPRQAQGTLEPNSGRHSNASVTHRCL